MASKGITTTKNYRLFKLSSDNRPLDLAKHRNLRESMRQYGFLKSFPVSCVRDSQGNLIVKDGQHRLAFAEELGLPVSYFVEDKDYDVAKVNSTAKVWQVRDYAMKHAASGVKPYQDGIDFAEAHGIPITLAFALLAGTSSFKNITDTFVSGGFKVKDRAYADSVATVYSTISKMSKLVKNARFLEACIAVCRVDGFEPERLIGSASRCREKLVSYSTRDAYLDMIEEIYNFHRKYLKSLKIEALQVMRDRNPTNRKKACVA